MYWLFQMPVSDTITTVGLRYNLRTGTPVAQKVSIQALTAGTATPSGTPMGGGSPAEYSFTPPADTTWDAGANPEFTLDNSIALTQGVVYALMLEPTGTPDGSNNSSWTHSTANLSARQGFPFAATISNGGSASLQSTGPIFWLKSATRCYGFPMLSFFNVQISSNTTPDEYAATITLPAGVCDTKKIRGIRASMRMSASGRTLAINLYDGTTSLQSITWDSDIGLTSDFRWFEIFFTDTTLATLNAGGTFRVGFAPQDTSSGFSLMGINLPNAACKSAWPGGDIFGWSSRTDGGAWSDDDTILPMIEFIMDDITEPAGGGGGLAADIFAGGVFAE